MSEDYIIQLTDPLNGVFIIKPYSANGNVKPIAETLHEKSAFSNTSLTLYGKGFPDYGEIHASNMVHILENFSGASEPQEAVQGQLWYLTEIYWLNTDTNEWFIWRENILGWESLVVVEQPLQPTENLSNDHWYNTDTNELYIFDGTTNTFVRRYHKEDIISPTSELPKKTFMVFDGTTWIPLTAGADQLGSDQVENDSLVVGATVTDALNDLLEQLNLLTSSSGVVENFAFTHVQTLPASSWVVTHNLNFPIVRVFINQSEVQPLDIIHESPSQTRIVFTGNQVGIVRFIGDNALSTDGFITSGVSSLGVLTLNKTLGDDIVIPNVAPTSNPTFTGNVQLSGSTTHLVLDHDPESDLEAATKHYVDYRVKWIEKPRLVTTSTGGTTFTTPEYIVGFNNLFVHINGKKEYSSLRGSQTILMSTNIIASSPTGLSNDTTVFTFDVLFDGVTTENVSVVGQNVQSFGELVDEINNDITLGHAVLTDFGIHIVSNSFSGTSAVNITNTGLFVSLPDFSTLGTPINGFIEDYNEVGDYGSVSTSIQFNSAVTIGDKLEFIIV